MSAKLKRLIVIAATALTLSGCAALGKAADLQCSLSPQVRAAERLAYFKANNGTRVIKGWCQGEPGFEEAVEAHITSIQNADTLRELFLTGEIDAAAALEFLRQNRGLNFTPQGCVILGNGLRLCRAGDNPAAPD